jgi:hypothetical protein|tara:strand:- start:779 stop:1099 length:321 start_codon:yes stop_codon:yes gene_type:complete
MFPFDSSFNELHIREKLILFGDHLVWLNDCAMQEKNLEIQNEIINQVIQLTDVMRCLEYFMDYERTANSKIQERSLDLAKLKLENRDLKERISNYEKALDNAAENI